MKRIACLLFFGVTLFLCMTKSAHANISPLTITENGVEPVFTPGVKIDYEDITVSPNNNKFLFSCNYGLKSSSDIENLCIGIPGDLGYTLEAGYIENMTILVNGQPVKFENYNTIEQFTNKNGSSKTSMHFKWYVFSIPLKKDVVTTITATYNISWRVLDQDQSSNYYIIPFILSTDSFFGLGSGKYKITYINDDRISIPDVKVMISSLLEPDIVSPSILSPEYNGDRIIWNFKDGREFQDFRLVLVSFRKLALDLSQDTPEESSVRWALLNNNYTHLANLFEDMARKEISSGIENNDESGTAAYAAAEYYYRAKNYDKALEMLELPEKITVWPSNIKYDYINAVKYDQSFKLSPLLDELKKLSSYKDYILVSDYANKKIEPVSSYLAQQEFEALPVMPKVKPEEKKDVFDIKYIYLAAGVLFLGAAVLIIIRIIKFRKKKTFW